MYSSGGTPNCSRGALRVISGQLALGRLGWEPCRVLPLDSATLARQHVFYPRRETSMDEWLAIETERRALADDLAAAPPTAWDAQSLCSEWKVRDVVAHLNAATEMTTGQALRGLVANGLNFNRFMARDAIARGAADPVELLAALRDRASSHARPPMAKPVDVLLDTVCHAQDIRRPLGIKREIPFETLVLAADRIKGYGFPFGTKKSIAGLRLVATDGDWSNGEGPEVAGPLEALVMTMSGRTSVADDLSGPGLGTFRSRR